MNTKGKIMRLLGQPATNTTPCEIDASTNLRSSAPHCLAFCVGKEILCLDKSQDGQRVVIGGPGIFKILKVRETSITEEIDLRAIIWVHASSHNSAGYSSKLNNNLAIVSVKWSHGDFVDVIIAASANGVITAYDLKQVAEGLEIARVQAHTREIYKLAINPHKPHWLLSASRDGTVKSWNIRSPKDNPSGAYFRLWHTFRCKSEVLDVEWSPTDGLVFACCTELGQVLKWDVRDPVKPNIRINAHVGQCYSVAWHPGGEHIASGGQDRFCYVWNFSKNGMKNQKALYILETRAPISIVSWRPAIWSATASAKRAAQITITYQDDRKLDALVEVWDLARPSLPFKQLPYKPRPTPKLVCASMGFDNTLEDIPLSDEGWDTAPTGILWSNSNILWTINNTIGTTNSGQSTVREGWFIQSNIALVPNTIEQRSLSNISFSPTGDILMILEERHTARQLRSILATRDISLEFPQSISPISNQSPSDSEGEIIGNFLGKRPKKELQFKPHKHTNQTSTAQTGSILVSVNVMGLEASINMTGIYKPQQVMAIGHTPSSTESSEFQFYSSHYLMRILKAPERNELPNDRITSILEDFANTAQSLGQNSLAQTWNLLGMSMDLLLTRRAEYHRDNRLKCQEFISSGSEAQGPFDAVHVIDDHDEKRKTFKSEIFNISRTSQNATSETISEEAESESNFVKFPGQTKTYIAAQTREAREALQSKESKLDFFEDTQITDLSLTSVTGANNTEISDHSYEVLRPLFSPTCPDSTRKNQIEADNFSETQDGMVTNSLYQSRKPDAKKSYISDKQKEDKSRRVKLSPKYKEMPFHISPNDASITQEILGKDSSHLSKLDNKNIYETKRPSVSLTPECVKEKDTDKVFGEFSPPPGQVFENPDLRPDQIRPPSLLSISQPVTTDPVAKKSPLLIPSDFLYAPSDPPFILPALDPTTILQQLVTYYTSAASTPLHVLPMLLLLLPYLPTDTINHLHASQIIAFLHARLNSLKLYVEATLLRNLCVPNYPEIYSPSQHNIRIGFFCTSCDKPFDPDPHIPNSHWKCSRCRGAMAFCPICEQQEYMSNRSDPNENEEMVENEDFGNALQLGTWWYCPGCAHGGHVACMLDWHAASEPEGELGSLHSGGACPVVGCLHACLAGSWREELGRERAALRERELGSSVRESLVNINYGNSSDLISNSGGVIISRGRKDLVQSQAIEGPKIIHGRGKRGLSK